MCMQEVERGKSWWKNLLPLSESSDIILKAAILWKLN